MKEKHGPDTSEGPSRNDRWGEVFREDKKQDQDIRVYLTVSGGLPAKAYHFSFAIEKNGQLHCRYNVKGQHKLETTTKAEPNDIIELTQLLAKTRVFDFQQPPPRFVPDTVVGKLEIYVGDLYHVQYFAADEKQAAHNQMPTHTELHKVLNWIYNRASQLLKKKNLKP